MTKTRVTDGLQLDYRMLIETGRRARSEGIESLKAHEPIKLSHVLCALAAVADLADGIVHEPEAMPLLRPSVQPVSTRS